MEYRLAANGKLLSENFDMDNTLRSANDNQAFKNNALSRTPVSVFGADIKEVKNAQEFASALSGVLDNEDTAEGLFNIFDINGDKKLTNDELDVIRDKFNGKITSRSIYNAVADGGIRTKEQIGGGRYKFGGNRTASDAAGTALPKELRPLPKSSQIEILKELGIDISGDKTPDERLVKLKHSDKTEFYKVIDDNGVTKVIHSVMDTKGNVDVKVFKTARYDGTKSPENLKLRALLDRKISERKTADIDEKAEYVFAPSRKKLKPEELQDLLDIHDKFSDYKYRKVKTGNEIKNENEFVKKISGILNDTGLAKSLFKFLDKDGNKKLSRNELKQIKDRSGITSQKIFNLTEHSNILVKRLIKSDSYAFDGKKTVNTEAGAALRNSEKDLMPRNDQIKVLKNLGIKLDLKKEDLKKKDKFIKIKTEKGTEFYKVYKDVHFNKVVHSIVDDKNNVKYEIFHVYNYSQQKRMNTFLNNFPEYRTGRKK